MWINISRKKDYDPENDALSNESSDSNECSDSEASSDQEVK